MKRSTKLGISVTMDVIGFSSYFIPIVGGLSDLAFAPIQAIWIGIAYKTTPFAILGGVEELLPLTDIIPSCTIAHLSQKSEEESK